MLRWTCLTQQDPIGLAGGLNLYGFGNGDPVNASDPFGLNPCLANPAACVAAASMVAFAGIQLAANALQGRPLLENVAHAASQGLTGGTLAVSVGSAIRAASLRQAAAQAATLAAEQAEIQAAGRAANTALSLADRAALRGFFGSSLEGAAAREADFRITEGLTREALENYSAIARAAIAAGKDELGVQAARLGLAERALRAMQ